MREVRDNDTDTGFIQGSSLLKGSTRYNSDKETTRFDGLYSYQFSIYPHFLILVYLWDIFLHDDTISAAHIERKKIPKTSELD